MSPVFETQTLLSLHVRYDVLPAENDLPTQIDITDAYVLVHSTKAKRPRKVRVLGALSESDIINLEDEIQESLP
jgi:hypothetical protein